MSSIQQSSLTFFNDNSLVSDKILQSDESFLSVLSHVQGTSPSWLINSIIENSLQGTAIQVNNELTRKTASRSTVYYVSFLHPKDFYVRNCKKNGIDLDVMNNFKFIDKFTNLFTKDLRNIEDGAQVAKDVFDNLCSTINSGSNDKNRVVFIEMPEILLSATSITSSQLLNALTKINRLSKQLFIVTSKNSPQQVDPDATIETDPVFKLTDFLVKLYHRSHLNIDLSPLATGKASDVTGCLTISKGSIPIVLPELRIEERRYIYHLTKESNIKLYFH